MAQFDVKKQSLVGMSGRLRVPKEDEVTRKLSMLIEGECDGLAEAQRLQVALGRIRRASGDYVGKLLAIDPHRMVPMKNERSLQKKLRAIPPEQFTRRWAGFATMKQPYQMAERDAGSLFQFVQRTGEKPDDYHLGAFLSTTDREEVDPLTLDYPKRWHVEEFFNAHQALGWKRAGTMNLNIRYGQMTMALLAQAALHQLRRRLGEPFSTWDASHLAKSLLAGLEGDVRVKDDTILITYYNAPNAERLRQHYTGLPRRLQSEHIDPHVPWLCGFKLDFSFR